MITGWHKELNERERRFCEAYSGNGGNGKAAALDAGYKNPKVQAVRLLKKDRIVIALEQIRTSTTKKAILTREQRQEFWSDVMRDEEADITARLRASELLGKSQADFTERHKHEGDLNVAFKMSLKEGEK